MNILQKNSINEINNGIKKNIFGEKSPNVSFNSNIKSVNLPEFYFTNFLEKRAPMVGCLKRERRKFLQKSINYDAEYEIKSIDTNKEQKKLIKY